MVWAECNDVKDLKAELFEGEEPPSCEVYEMGDRDRAACGKRNHGIGSLGPRMVLYNECNAHQEVINAVINADLKFGRNAVIVVDTSLKKFQV